MYYINHYFREIRLRIFYIFLACVVSFLLGYLYKYELFYILSKPFLKFQSKFIFFDFTEGLYTMINIITLVCFVCNIPLVLYHFWNFFSPSWYISEKKAYSKFFKVFLICFVFEFLFIYFFIFPKLCEFFVSFEMYPTPHSQGVQSLSLEFTPRVASYIRIFSQFFLMCLLFFQLPFVFLGLFSKKIINCYTLCQQRKLVFFVSVLCSALVSPPDLVSQLFLSILLYGIYELSIFLGFLKKSEKLKIH